METLLLILAIIALLAGLAGAILPIPGPPLSFLGLLLLKWSNYATLTPSILWSFGIATVLVAILDYTIPVWGTKKFGGTRAGGIGALIGMFIGLLLLPGVGLFLGTFLGAFAGEILSGNQLQASLKAAVGSFIGILTGLVLKILLCLAMVIYAIVAFF